MRALRISAFGLLATAVIELAVVAATRSAALFSDGLHNLGDVLTTVALWIAFIAARRAADDRYTFGYQRFEDLAGLGIVLAIFLSAGVAAYEAVSHLRSGVEPTHLLAGVGAGLIGAIGNEICARIKINAGRRIGSEPLIAEGRHSRADGLTSLGVLVGLGGVALGAGWADPVAGLVIAAVIVVLGVQSSREVIAKLVDRVDPAVVERIAQAAISVDAVTSVHSIRARWAGRGLYVLLHVTLPPDMQLSEVHARTEQVRHAVLHALPQIVQVDVHVDPDDDADHHSETHHHFHGDH